MDEHRKNAYRTLLYRAMLDIRPIQWMRLSRVNPLSRRQERKRIRRAGTIAELMHNLAFFAAMDFERFDEQRFWNELEKVDRLYPDYRLGEYKSLFTNAVAGVNGAAYG